MGSSNLKDRLIIIIDFIKELQTPHKVKESPVTIFLSHGVDVGPVYREPGRRQRHSTSRPGRPSARLGGTRLQVIFTDKNRREGMFARESMSRDALSRAEAAERKLADLQEHFNAVLQVLSHVSLFQ